MRSFLVKAGVLFVVAWLLIVLPSPIGSVPFAMKNGAVVISTVLYLGKLLYDTLFYDHFLP